MGGDRCGQLVSRGNAWRRNTHPSRFSLELTVSPLVALYRRARLPPPQSPRALDWMVVNLFDPNRLKKLKKTRAIVDKSQVGSAMIITVSLLGLRQAVRQRVLVSPFLGSNPRAPVFNQF